MTNDPGMREYRCDDNDGYWHIGHLPPAVRNGDTTIAEFRVVLTRREAEVLDLISHGLSYAQVGQKLGIHESTVRGHITNLLGKLGAENGPHAVRRGFELGLLTSQTGGA